MSGRFASLHAGLLLRERPRAAPPPSCIDPVQAPSAVVRRFPTVTPLPPPQAADKPRPASRRRSFTVRLDEAQHTLLQIAKLRFGLSGQRLLLMALEKLMGTAGR
jgi:hypothetical protein